MGRSTISLKNLILNSFIPLVEAALVVSSNNSKNISSVKIFDRTYNEPKSK